MVIEELEEHFCTMHPSRAMPAGRDFLLFAVDLAIVGVETRLMPLISFCSTLASQTVVWAALPAVHSRERTSLRLVEEILRN